MNDQLYHTLLTFEDGKWAPQFGDFEYCVVKQEADDVYADIKHTIVATPPGQEAIDAVVKSFNDDTRVVRNYDMSKDFIVPVGFNSLAVGIVSFNYTPHPSMSHRVLGFFFRPEEEVGVKYPGPYPYDKFLKQFDDMQMIGVHFKDRKSIQDLVKTLGLLDKEYAEVGVPWEVTE